MGEKFLWDIFHGGWENFPQGKCSAEDFSGGEFPMKNFFLGHLKRFLISLSILEHSCCWVFRCCVFVQLWFWTKWFEWLMRDKFYTSMHLDKLCRKNNMFKTIIIIIVHSILTMIASYPCQNWCRPKISIGKYIK